MPRYLVSGDRPSEPRGGRLPKELGAHPGFLAVRKGCYSYNFDYNCRRELSEALQMAALSAPDPLHLQQGFGAREKLSRSAHEK